MRAASVLFALFALSALFGGPRHSAGAQRATELPAGLPAGALALVDADAADKAVEAAITQGLGGLQPAMRDAFRAQLRASMRLPRSLEFREGGAEVRHDELSLEAPVGGAAVAQRGPEGRRVQVQHALEGDALVETLGAPQYTRTNTFRAADEGVVLELSLSSRLLPRPLSAEARYARP